MKDHPGTEDRFVEFRHIDEQDDSILFHGHVHEHWKFKPGMANVGVDVWGFKPVEIQQILQEYYAQDR